MNTNPNLPRLLADLKLIGGALSVLHFDEEKAIVIDTDTALFSVYYNQSAFVKRAADALQFYGFEIHNVDIRLGKVQFNLKEPEKKVEPIVSTTSKPIESVCLLGEDDDEKPSFKSLRQKEEKQKLNDDDTIALSIKQIKSLVKRANGVKPKFIDEWIYNTILELKRTTSDVE